MNWGKYVSKYIKKRIWWSYLIYSSLWNCASGSEIPSRSHVVTRGQRLLSIRAPLGGGTWWISERCSFHLLTGEIAWGRWRVPDKRDPPPCLTLINIQLCPLNPSRWGCDKAAHLFSHLFIYFKSRRMMPPGAGDYDVAEAVQMDGDALTEVWCIQYFLINA